MSSEKGVIRVSDITVSEIIEEIKVAMCNDYCRFPNEFDEEKEGCELYESEICGNCPLNRL